mmetsp:Transcript_98612/g.279482  ORF Transcript_98612/g.279482 Transcript_98612/m.279482 type:complete len:373 (+) Transcript_98612:1410-2528(+)
MLLGELAEHDAVGVGADVAHVRDAGVRADERELHHIRVEVDGPLAHVQVHVRVHDPQVQYGVDGSPAGAQAHLEDLRDAVRLELVSDRRHRGLHEQHGGLGADGHAVGPERPGGRGGLHGVFEDLALGRGLHRVHVQRRDVRHARGLRHHLLEGHAADRRDARPHAGLVDGDARDGPEGALPLVEYHFVVDHLGVCLQDQGYAALAPGVAAGGGVEGEGAAEHAEVAPRGAVGQVHLRQDHVPARAHGVRYGLPVPGPREVRAGVLDRDQGRGGLDVAGKAGAFEAVGEGEAPAGDAAAGAADAAALEVLLRGPPLAGRRVRHVHAPPGVHDRGDLVPGAHQGLVAGLHAHAVPYVHAGGLGPGDPKGRVVE